MSETKQYSESEVKEMFRDRARKRADRLRRNLVARAEQRRATITSPVIPDSDPLAGKYTAGVTNGDLTLVEPRYPFHVLKRIREESDILGALIDVMKKNIEGFGFGLRFGGDDLLAKKPENDTNRQFLNDFFTYTNDTESFVTLASRKRDDMETYGGGALEIMESEAGGIAAIYQLPMELIRGTVLDTQPTPVTYKVMRGGKLVDATYRKYFRRFVLIDQAGKVVKVMKEYGDPRNICRETGKDLGQGANRDACASSLLLDTLYAGNYLYGLPRWMGAIMDILGRRNAQQVNWDLFDSQGIPPLIIMVSGGTLTEDSYDNLMDMFYAAQGVTNFNRALLLEANSDALGLDDKSNTARIDFKAMTEARKDDQMFTRYLEATAKTIRAVFRIPPLLLGMVDDYCHFEDTETLTEDGWLPYDAVGERKIAVVDPETRELSFEKPEALHVFDAQERDMFHFDAQAVNCMVTGQHGMYAAFANTRYPKRANHALKWERFLPSEIYALNYRRRLNFLCAPDSYAGDIKEVCTHIPIPDLDLFLEFLGFAVADANISLAHKWPSHQHIRFTVKKDRKKKLYTQVCKQLEKYGAQVRVYDMKTPNKIGYMQIDVLHDGLWRYMTKNCLTDTREKKLPDWFHKLSAYYSDVLLKALVFGDGSQNRAYDSCYYATTSAVLADQVQILGMLAGYRARLTEREDSRSNRKKLFSITLAPNNTTELRAEQVAVRKVTGKVFCFDVGDRLFVTRRNGIIGIHFNSLANARAAVSSAESQVFIPERILSDEKVNRRIIQQGFSIHDWFFYNKSLRIAGSDETVEMMKAFQGTGAFTINQAILYANDAFGTQMSVFDAEWANYPYDVVMELLRSGRLKGLDSITTAAVTQNANAMQQYQNIHNIDPSMADDDNVKEAKRHLVSTLPATEATLYTVLDKLRNCMSAMSVMEASVNGK